MQKNHNWFSLSRLSKAFVLLSITFYLSGYQPALGFPPIKQSQAQAYISDQQVKIESAGFSAQVQLPHPGYLTTHYSSWHPGVDIATGLGMPIRPILPGRVTEVTYGFWGLGHEVIVEHEQGYRSTYGHMGRIYVKVGDPISQSSVLGEVGLTGNTSGPHTHLELTRNGEYINPEIILPQIPDFQQYASSPSAQITQ